MTAPAIPLFGPGQREQIEAAAAPPPVAEGPIQQLPPVAPPGVPGPAEGPVQQLPPVVPPVVPQPIQAAAPAPPVATGIATQDAAGAALAAGQAEQVAARADMDAATSAENAAKADFDAEHAKRLEQQAAEFAKHREVAESEISLRRAKAENAPWTTYYGSRSAGQKALQAIGLLLTGISWNSNHVNRGVELLRDAEREHMEIQKQQHEQLYKDLDLASQGLKDLDAHQLREVSALQTRDAARYQALASKMGQAIASAKGRYDTSVLQQQQAVALSHMGEAHDNAVKAAATARHMDAQSAKIEAETKEIPATSESLRKWREAQSRAKARKAGGGGGSTDALAQFAEGAGKLAAGDPIPPELVALGRRAGLKPNQIAQEADRYRGSGAKSEKLDLQGEKIRTGMENTAASLEATDDKGNVLGKWKDPATARKGTQQIQRFHRVEDRLVELIKDVETNGERIGFDSKEWVRRQSLAEAVAAALRPYNELSSTDASMRAERAILGPTGAFGHGWALGADTKTLKHILEEARGQQKANLNTMLRSTGKSEPSGGGSEGGIPAGAQTGTFKDGTRGYRLNGKSYNMDGTPRG